MSGKMKSTNHKTFLIISTILCIVSFVGLGIIEHILVSDFNPNPNPYTTNEIIDYLENMKQGDPATVIGIVEEIQHCSDTDYEGGANSKIIALELGSDRKKRVIFKFKKQSEKFNSTKIGDKVIVRGYFEYTNYHAVWLNNSRLE